MVSGFSAELAAGMLVSQWADAIRIDFGLGSALPSPAMAAPGWLGSIRVIGEPWETKRVGRRGMGGAPGRGISNKWCSIPVAAANYSIRRGMRRSQFFWNISLP